MAPNVRIKPTPTWAKLRLSMPCVPCGPVTLSADFGYLKLVITHAAAVHGVDVRVEPVNLARVALKRLGLVGKSRQRDRRPTREEIKRLLRNYQVRRPASQATNKAPHFASF